MKMPLLHTEFGNLMTEIQNGVTPAKKGALVQKLNRLQRRCLITETHAVTLTKAIVRLSACINRSSSAVSADILRDFLAILQTFEEHGEVYKNAMDALDQEH